MSDIHERLAVLEEKLTERRRREDKIQELLEEIYRKQTHQSGFLAGVAAAVSMIWAVIILAYDEIKNHLMGH